MRRYGLGKESLLEQVALGMLSVLVVLVSLSAARAAEKEGKTVELKPMVVVGEKEGTNSVTLEDLENREPADLRELFSRSPSVSVGGGSAQAQKLFIRSMEDTLLNVTVDGAQQAGNLFHHQGRLTIDPELLRKVDVSSGLGGSALNGPGALGGAVKFETKNVFDLREEGKEFGAKVKAGGFTNGEGFKASGYGYGMVSEDLGFLGYVTGTKRENYKAGGGDEVDNTAYDRISALLKGSGRLAGGHNFDVSYEVTVDTTEGASTRPNLISPIVADRDFLFSRNTVTINYGYQPGIDWLDLESTLYFTQHEASHKRTVSTDTLDKTGAGVRSVGLDLRNTSKIRKLSLTYGVDFRTDVGYVVNRNVTVAVRDGEDERSTVLGGYLQGEYLLFDDMVKAFAGVRLDSYDYKDYQGQRFDSAGVSPNVGVAVYPLDGLTMSVGYSQAYRGVGMPEVFLIGPARRGAPAYVNDKDLESEKAENYEFRADYQSTFFYANTALYHQVIHNVTPQVGYDAGGVRTNLGKFQNKGYEVLVGARYNGLHAAVGVADSKPEIDGERITELLGIAITTGRRWTAYLDYTHEEWGLKTGWSMQYLEESPTLKERGGTFTKDAYAVHNMYANWKPDFVGGLELGLRVDNIFDKKYLDQYHFSYNLGANPFQYATMPSPGRALSLSVGYEF